MSDLTPQERHAERIRNERSLMSSLGLSREQARQRLIQFSKERIAAQQAPKPANDPAPAPPKPVETTITTLPAQRLARIDAGASPAIAPDDMSVGTEVQGVFVVQESGTKSVRVFTLRVISDDGEFTG